MQTVGVRLSWSVWLLWWSPLLLLGGSEVQAFQPGWTTTTTTTTLNRRYHDPNNNKDALQSSLKRPTALSFGYQGPRGRSRGNKRNIVALNNHAHAAHISVDLSQLGIFGSLMQDPIFWSTAIMISIVTLLYSWEQTITSARNALPKTLQPVVDSMLVEMGGLGFIGLFLSVAVIGGPLGGVVGAFSEQFLGNEEILLESFEFLHTAFFEVAVSFFVIAASTVASVVRQVESLEMVSRAVFDLDGDGDVTLTEVAKVLNVEGIVVDLDGDGHLSDEEISYALEIAPRISVWTEVFKATQDAQAEALLVRERLVEEFGIIDESFELEKYFVEIFGKNLEEMVELSPLTWLPLIPVVALGSSIDLSRDVVSASSINAFESSGIFISDLGYLEAQTLSVTLSLIWGVWNFWKMVSIKDMLVPTLVCDTGAGGEAVLLPPRYEDEKQLKEFNSSPFPFNLVEGVWGKPATNNQEELFGAAGRKGPSIYRNSIKFHTWFVVAQLVFLGTQIVSRDVAALSQGIPETVARPDLLLPELGLYGFYAAMLVGQLWLVPKTFLDYSLVTSIERLTKAEVLSEACVFDGECMIPLDGEEQDASNSDSSVEDATVLEAATTTDTVSSTAPAPVSAAPNGDTMMMSSADKNDSVGVAVNGNSEQSANSNEDDKNTKKPKWDMWMGY